jgi:hypothetical protein
MRSLSFGIVLIGSLLLGERTLNQNGGQHHAGKGGKWSPNLGGSIAFRGSSIDSYRASGEECEASWRAVCAKTERKI